MYVHYFKVTGTGSFPADMLRYDACYPRRPEDVDALYGYTEHDALVTVELIHRAPTKRDAEQGPTPRRWGSFGWTFESIEIERRT